MQLLHEQLRIRCELNELEAAAKTSSMTKHCRKVEFVNAVRLRVALWDGSGSQTDDRRSAFRQLARKVQPHSAQRKVASASVNNQRPAWRRGAHAHAKIKQTALPYAIGIHFVRIHTCFRRSVRRALVGQRATVYSTTDTTKP